MPRISDLNAIARQWEMLQLLPKKLPGITSGELQKKLDNHGYPVVKRTVERDLQALSEAFPILCNDKGKPYGWYWNPEASANLPGITLAEALSLRLVEDLLKPLLPKAILSSLQAQFNQAQAKLASLQPENATANWQNKVRHVPPTLPLLPPKLDEAILETVQQALLNDKQLDVKYQGVHTNQPAWRILHPLALVQRGTLTYLVATAFKYQDVRIYALHRFCQAKMLSEPSQRPIEFDIDTYIAAGHLHFGDDDLGPIKLKTWVSDGLAAYLEESRLSEDQTLVQDSNDGYLLSATVLEWWIRSMGAGIVVVEPVDLKEALVGDLEGVLAKYSLKHDGGSR